MVMNPDNVKYLRGLYTGKSVISDGTFAPVGMKGVVWCVTDDGVIVVRWDNGDISHVPYGQYKGATIDG